MEASITPFIILSSLLTTGFAYPSNSFQCSRYCKEEWNKFGYQIGTSYAYSYVGDVKTLVNATNSKGINQETGLTLNANVVISVISNCDLILKVTGDLEEQYLDKNNILRTKLSNSNREFSSALSEYPLYFSFQNGRIETICPFDQENTGILNVKKGILSILQNSMPNLSEDSVVYETDVSGNCETQYKSIQNGPYRHVTKIKNFDACSHRKSKHLSWLSVPYSKTTRKTQPLLRSTQTCTQIFNDKMIIDSIECDEKHIFQPFSNDENGAMALVNQKLHLTSHDTEIKELNFPKNYHHEPLLLVHETNREKSPSLDRVVNILKELDAKTTEGVEKEVPKIFSQLVDYIRNLDFDNIQELFENVREHPRQKKSLLDAMPLITTLDGIRVMKELFKNGEISESQFDSWITSLVFIKNPSVEIIAALSPLMELENEIKQKAVLTVSSLIYIYCKEDQQCTENSQIMKAIKSIGEPIAIKCAPTSPEMQNKILLSLKGIGNAGIATSLNNLRRCYSNSDMPVEIQLAAIAAHRRINCGDNSNLEELLDYFADPRQRTEIRIASYLAAMQCASYATFARVRDVLRSEETNQVGSFVWTHLTNLQETSSKWKQNLRNLVENEFLRNKFSTDLRKYSRNYETSMYFDSINAGATMESNVVFTSESYLPKSAMLNLTLDIFGEAVNIFEIGGRIEGFEQVIENLFGPEGYFPEDSIKRLLEDVRGRDTHREKLEELGNAFNTQNVLKKEPSGMLYAKIFGNELTYTQFHDLKEIIHGPINGHNILEALMKLFKEQDVDYNKSFVFLDSAYAIPTSIGFPLKLTANGVATVGFTVKGKVDVKNLWSKKFLIDGKIYPSASVQITGSFMIDGVVTKTGLKSIHTLNSNTYLDGHILVDGGKLVDLKLNVPKKEMNIINVDSEILLFQNETDFRMEDISSNIERWDSCTAKTFSRMIGFEICQNLKYVNASMENNAPFFPLTGKFKYSLDIKKTDYFDSYLLQFNTQTIVNKYRPLYAMSLYVDTPNSVVNRKINVSYQLDFENLSLKAELTSPFANLKINSKIGDDYDKLNFVLQTLFNNKEIVYLKTALKSQNVNDSWRYEPSLKLNYNEKQILMVSGNFDYVKGAEYNADLKIDGFGHESVSVKGKIYHDNELYQIDASINSKHLIGNSYGNIVIKSNFINISTETNYNFNRKDQQFYFNFQGYKKRDSNFSEDYLRTKIFSTQKPIYNSELLLSSYRKHLYMKNNGILSLFGITWNTEQLFKFHKNRDYYDVALKCDLTCKRRNIDYKIALVHNASEETFLVHGLLQLNRVKRTEMLIDYNRVPDQKSTVTILLYYPRQAWILNGTLAQEKSNEYMFSFRGYRESDEKKIPLIVISGTYTNVTTDEYDHYKINGTLEIPGDKVRLGTPWTITSIVQISPGKFVNINNLQAGDTYVSHLAWSPESFSCVLQVNTKQILVVSGIKKEQELTAFLSLNIYQHFEWSTTLILPYEKFEMSLYWDKDRDLDQKMTLLFKRNVQKGLYNAVLEYPNQRITAAVVFLPTQITMNVTWGVELSQQIYLKAGNKVYDIGGVWFAKLETPFRYLESQEFHLSYYILPQSAELKLDVSWRDQKINFIILGIRSPTHLSGSIQLNTTIPEISKVNVAISHSHNNTQNCVKIRNDATVVFNDHQIRGQSIWEAKGLNVTAAYEIVSPTDSIDPLIGSIIMKNNQTTNMFDGFVSWRNKKIAVEYKFENSHSYIKISTPFEGIEETDFDYIIIGEADKLILEVKANILKQYNHGLLSWHNQDHATKAQIRITCPFIGEYNTEFRHSTIFGHFEELFVVTQGKDNVIITFELNGDFLPILEAEIEANLKFLHHKASLHVKNKPNPIQSELELNWDNNYVVLSGTIFLKNDIITDVRFDVTSSLTDKVILRYIHDKDVYVLSANLPNGYKISNKLMVNRWYSSIENVLKIDTPNGSGSLNYMHDIDDNKFDNKIVIKIGRNESKLILHYKIDDRTKFIDEANAELETPWYHPLHVNFSMPFDKINHFYKPIFHLEYDEGEHVIFEASVNYTREKSDIFAKCLIANIKMIDFNISYDFTKENKKIEMIVVKNHKLIQFTSEFGGNPKKSIFFNAIIQEPNKFIYFDSELKYNIEKPLKLIKFHMNLPIKSKFYEFDALSGLDLDVFKTKVNFTSSINNWSKLLLDSIISLNPLNQKANFYFEKCNNSVNATYFYKKYRDSSKGNLNLLSTFEILPNSTVELIYKSSDKNQLIELIGLIGKRKLTAFGDYKIISEITSASQEISLDSGLIVNYFPDPDRNFDHFDFDTKMKGFVSVTRSGGKLNAIFNSNFEKFQSIDLIANYSIDHDGYDFHVSIDHNTDLYSIEHKLETTRDSLKIVANLRTPSWIYGDAFGDFFYKKTDKEIDTFLRIKKRLELYNVSLSTIFDKKLLGKFLINTKTTDNSYNGYATLNFSGTELRIDSSLKNDNDNKLMELYLTTSDKEKIEINLYSNLSIFALEPINLLIQNHNKKCKINFQTQYGIDLNASIDNDNFKMNVTFFDQFANIHGNHKIDSLTNFSFNYFLITECDKTNIQMYNKIEENFQTKIDLFSTYRDLGEAKFASGIDKNRISVAFQMKSYKFEVFIDKNIFKPKFLLLIEGNKATPLSILFNKNTFRALSHTQYGHYQFEINIDNNKYSIVYKKNHKKIFFIDIFDVEIEGQLKFKSNFGSSYFEEMDDNLTMIFSLRYHPKKTLLLSVYNASESIIFHLRTDLELNQPTCKAKLEITSNFEILQSLSVSFLLKRLEELQLHFAKKQYYRETKYHLELYLPLNSIDKKFIIVFPDEEHQQWSFVINSNHSGIDFLIRTPWENYRKIYFHASLKKITDFSRFQRISSEIKFHKNDFRIETIWHYSRTDSNSLIELEIFNSPFVTKKDLDRVIFKVFYEFDKKIEAIFQLDEIDQKINVSLFKDDQLFQCESNMSLSIFLINSLHFHANLHNRIGNIDLLINNNTCMQLITYIKNDNNKKQIFLSGNILNETFQPKIELEYNCNITNITLNIDSKMYNYMLKIKSNLHANSDFSNGNFSNFFLNGYIEEEPKLNEINAAWIVSNSNEEKIAKFALQKNSDVSYIEFRHFLVKNQLKSSIIITCMNKIIKLNLDGIININNTNINLLITTPLKDFNEIRFKTDFMKTGNSIEIQTGINWPDNQQINLFTLIKSNNKMIGLRLTFVSPFTRRLHARIDYNKKIDNQLELSSLYTLGKKEIEIKTVIVPNKFLIFNFKSPFSGYTTANFTVDYKENYLKISFWKENLMSEFHGFVNTTNKNFYEINMTSTDLLNENYGKMLLKIDSGNMNGKIDIFWKNHEIDIDYGFNPDRLYLNIDSPFDFINNVRVQGKYENNNNNHRFNTEGTWNKATINISSTLIMKDNNFLIQARGELGKNYQGALNYQSVKNPNKITINFDGFFPNKTSEILLNYQIETVKQRTNSKLLIKTPFNFIKNLTNEINISDDKLTIDLLMNIIDDDLVINFDTLFKNDQINYQFLLDVPQIETKWIIESNMSLQKTLLKIDQLLSKNWSNLTIDYLVENYEFQSHYIIENDDKPSVNFTVLGFWKNSIDDQNYGLLINYYGLQYKSYQNAKNIKKFIYANIPDLLLDNLEGLFEIDFEKVKIQSYFHYNKYKIDVISNKNYDKLYTEVTSNLYDKSIKIDNIIMYKLHESFRMENNISDSTRWIFTEVYLKNTSEILHLMVKNNFETNYDLELFFNKNLTNFLLNISDLFKIEVKSERFLEFLLFFNCWENRNLLSIDLNPNDINFEIIAPIFNVTRTKAKLNFSNKILYREIKFFYFEDEEITFENVAQFYWCEIGYVVNTTLFYKREKIVQLSGQIDTTNSTSGSFEMNIFDSFTSIFFLLNVNDPYLGGLTIQSPFLKYNGITFEVGLSDNNAFLFVGSGPSKLQKSLIIDPTKHEKYILIQGKHENTFFNLQYEAPWSTLLEYFNFQSKINTTGPNINIDLIASIKIESETFGHLLIDTKFQLDPNGIDTELHLNQPFIETMKTFDFNLRMPFGYDLFNFDPRVSIAFPNNQTYSAYLSYVNVSEEFQISAGYQWDIKKFHWEFLLIKTFIPSVHFEILLPVDNNNFYVLSIKGLDNFHDTTNHASYLQLFNKKYELIYAISYQINQYLFKLNLNTPRNQYYFNLNYENTNKKIIKALLFYPSLNQEIGFDSSIISNSLKRFQSIIKILLPFDNQVEFLLNHDITLKNNNKEYKMDFFTKINNFSTGIDLHAGLQPNQIYFDLNANLNRKKFRTNLKAIGNILNNIDFTIDISTPLKSLNEIELFFVSLNRISQEFHAGFRLNREKIAETHFSIVDNVISLEIVNLWRPISMSYSYVNGKNLKILGVFCYNSTDKENSQIGLHVDYNKNITGEILLPGRKIGLIGNYFIDDTKEFYFGKFYWNNNDTISVTRLFINQTNNDLLQLYSLTSIVLPFTNFELIDDVQVNYFENPSIRSILSFRWGKNSESNTLSFTSLVKSGYIESKLSLPPLKNDIVLKLNMTPTIAIPSYFRAELEYSPEIAKRIEFEMFYDRTYTDVFKIERKFSFKHLDSKIDYSLHFKSVRTPEYTSGNVVLEYMNYLINQREKMKCSLRIGHEKFDVAGELKTTKSCMNFAISSKSSLDHQDLSISLQVNDKEPLIMKGKYNFQPMEPSVLISTSYGDNRKYDFYAGVPSRREITAKLMHEIYNNPIIDALFTMKLNTSQILWIKMLWKNELFAEFKTAVLEEYRDLRFIIEATGQQLIDIIDDDLGRNLFEDISELQKNISMYSTREQIIFKDDYNRFINETQKAYYNDAFFCQTIQKLLPQYIPNFDKYKKVIGSIQEFLLQLHKGFIASISNTVTSIEHIFDVIHNQINNLVKEIKDIKDMKAAAKELLKKGIEEARKSLKEMDILVVKLIEKSDEIVTNIKKKCDEFFDPYLKLVDDLVIYVEQRLAFFQMMILDILDTVQHYILNLRESREILQVYVSYINWLEELHLSEILDPIADTIEAILETIIGDVENIIEEYKPYFIALSNAIFGNYQEINKLPPLAEFREYFNNIYQRILWIWNYHNLSEVLKTHFHKMVSDVDDFLSSFFTIENSNTDFENVLGQSDYIFRPDMGIIEISQPLPVEWESFDKMPVFEEHPLYQKIKQKSENLLQLQRYKYFDFLDVIKSYICTNPTNLLSPPTNNIGMFIGTSHYITFDKHYYKFSGECSYLLASDFITNTFSLIVNYQLNGTVVKKRSLSIISEGNELEISSIFGVKLNGKEANLPLFLDHLTAIQDNSEITIENSKGMKVSCSLYYDFCTVKLSGWFFGKTGGLLGTMDNERSTDMSLPDGSQTSDVMEFVQSWQIGTNQCGDVNHANDTMKKHISPLSLTLFDTLCQLFFVNSNSPFGRCFNLIDSKPYYDICVSDMQDNVNPSICSSLAAYRAQCESANVILEMPLMCVHCPYDINENEKILDGNNPKSIDATFIIQDDCFVNNSFANLPQHLDRHLKVKGFLNNRFSSIGYGKSYHKPYKFIEKGKFWSDSKTPLELTLNTSNSNMKETITGIDAINFAATNLDFRPGVSKIFVLMQCESRSGQDHLNMIHNLLGEKDITLHVLKKTMSPNINDELLELGRNDHILYYNPGYNSSGGLNVQKMSRFMDWNTKEVTDSYMLLGLSTNGTVLNVHSEKSTIENLENLWANVISQSVQKSPCQKCKCIVNHDGNGKTECTRCLSPTVKQLLDEYESNGMKFGRNFENEEDFL